MKTGTFGRLSYAERQGEYPRTQEVGEASHFHGRDGLQVPSARSDHLNIVVLRDRAGPAAVDVVRDHGIIDWLTWRKQPFGYRSKARRIVDPPCRPAPDLLFHAPVARAPPPFGAGVP